MGEESTDTQCFFVAIRSRQFCSLFDVARLLTGLEKLEKVFSSKFFRENV